MCIFHLLKRENGEDDDDSYIFYKNEKQSKQFKEEIKTPSKALLIGSGTFDPSFNPKKNKVPDEFLEDRESQQEDMFYFWLSIVAILFPVFLMWAFVFPSLIIFSNWFWLTIIFSVYLVCLSVISLCLTRHSNPGILPKRSYGSIEDQEIFRKYSLAPMKTKYTRDHLAPEKTIM